MDPLHGNGGMGWGLEAVGDTNSCPFSKPPEEEKEETPKTPMLDSIYHKSKLGVLEESAEWDDYSDNEQIMLEYTSRLIDTYLDTVRKNLIDSMPKVLLLRSLDPSASRCIC